MIAGCLRAVNFRNLKDICFSPCPGVNILFGDNAQGKTNLIEALWLFTGERSFRGSKDPEFIGFGENFARLSLDFSAGGTGNSAAMTFSDVKKAELNGIKLDGVSSFAGRFCAVVFSPDNLELVKSGPHNRRDFIDCAITEILPRHAKAIAEYREVMRQRNALLKDIPSHSELIDTLPIWDEKLSQCGARIVFARLRYLNRLAGHAGSIYGGIASQDAQGTESLGLEYEAAGSPGYPQDVSDSKKALSEIRAKLLSLVASQRSGDIDCGYTRSGPHRDDLKISIGGTDARLYASQGQQRSAVLALKFAEAAVLTESVGEPPVLLLDDVMSELDRSRQSYILNNIGGYQVFITCCDPGGLKNLSGGSFFKVSSGGVYNEGGLCTAANR